MEFVMPAFACIVVVFGLIKKVPVFDVFISGAKEGVKLLYNIAPTIMGLVFAVDLLQSSGAIDAICSLIQPTAEFLGFPKEIVPLVLLRPVSGSGSTSQPFTKPAAPTALRAEQHPYSQVQAKQPSTQSQCTLAVSESKKFATPSLPP